MVEWIKRLALGLAVFAGAGLIAAAAAPAPIKAGPKGNWLNTVRKTPDASYVMGNPVAPVKLVEFVSYTCPHCAQFEIEATDELKVGMVMTGKGSVEVRTFLRNPIDIAASLLAQCGAPSRFFGNHAAFLRGQRKWLVNAQLAGPSQQQRWAEGDFSSRMRAIATDLDFYAIMASRGYDRATADRCLANEPLAELLAARTNDAVDKLKIHGTPSFMINGTLQEDVHSWAALRPKLLPLTR